KEEKKRTPSRVCETVFFFKQRDTVFLRFFHDLRRPQRTLDFPDVSFAQEEHTNTGLADSAAGGIRQFLFQNGFLERKICPLRTSGSLQLTGQRFFIHADSHGGKLQGDIQNRVVDDDITV